MHHEGDLYPVESLLDIPGATPVPVFLAALAPLMLRLAGERAAGTITWMCDEHTHATHVVPRLSTAAESVGRPTPRVIAGLPVTVCSDRDEGLEVAAKRYAMYREIPTYARVLALGESGGARAGGHRRHRGAGGGRASRRTRRRGSPTWRP